MTGTTFLQIFLLVDAFIIGVLAAVSLRHANAHFRPAKHEPETTTPPKVTEPLPSVTRERMLQTSQAQFQTVLNNSADQLLHDLKRTGDQVNNLVMRLASEIVSGELERYRAELNQLHKQATIDLGGIKKDMTAHETELKEKVAQELEAEKQRLIKQIDTKLSDAVGSFLLETLQHNVDLGSQASYLIELLEEHKADFVREVTDDA